MVHLIFIICILLALPMRKNKKVNLYWFSFFILCIFSVLRYGFGNDYFSYERIFNSIHGQGSDDLAKYYSKQYLFVFLNSISPSFYFFVGLTSIIFLCTICFWINKNCNRNYQWIAILIFLINPYLYLMNLSAIRQCMAMVLFIIATDFAYKKNFLIYVLLIAVATLFHSSAIILLPIYFIIDGKPIKRTMIILIIGIVSFLLLVPDVLQNLIEFVINQVFSDTTYDLYLGGGNTLRATILSSVYFFYVLFNIRNLSGKKLAYAKLYLCGTIFNILAFRFSMLTRMTMYFDIFSVVVIPYLLSEVKITDRMSLQHRKQNVNGISLLINKYIFPCLIFAIYILRYYSFFTNPMWESFRVYKTIFSIWL